MSGRDLSHPEAEESDSRGLQVERLTCDQALHAVEALTSILADCVAGGASVGFMDDAARSDLVRYWNGVVSAVVSGETLLFAASDSAGRISGTIQLNLATPPNQPHRAAVSKLLVGRWARRQGIAGALLAAAEAAARQAGRSLLVLDTEAGSAAEQLYRSRGWVAIGVIPRYALMPDGSACDTTFFYRDLLDA